MTVIMVLVVWSILRRAEVNELDSHMLEDVDWNQRKASSALTSTKTSLSSGVRQRRRISGSAAER